MQVPTPLNTTEVRVLPNGDIASSSTDDQPPTFSEDHFEALAESRPASRAATKDEEYGAAYMAKRYLETQNLVFQLENYYAVRHHGFAEARHKALKNVYGIIIDDHGIEAPMPVTVPAHMIARRSSTDEAIDQMSIKKAQKTEAKLRAKVETALNKMTFYHQCVPTYRAHFASLISSRDLHTLRAQKYTREQNNPKSGPNMIIERPPRGKGPPLPIKTVADLPGKAMYDRDFLENLLRRDEDYSRFEGPGIDLMTAWDRKVSKAGLGLGALQSLNAAAVAKEASSPHSPGQKGNHTPMSSLPTHAALAPFRARTLEEQQELEAQSDLHEYGRRLSHFADHEANNIDRNYMQQYLEASNNNL